MLTSRNNIAIDPRIIEINEKDGYLDSFYNMASQRMAFVFFSMSGGSTAILVSS